MNSKIIAATLLAATCIALHAQAPNAQTQKNEAAWSNLATGKYGQNIEIRIQTNGKAIRCDLDIMSSTTVSCRQHRNIFSPINDLIIPPQTWSIPRADIHEIRTGGREVATLAGCFLGIGFGIGLGSLGSGTNHSGDQFVGGIIFGIIGAIVGRNLPFKGHVIYRAP